MIFCLEDWVEIPPRAPYEIQRVGQVKRIEYDVGGRVYKFSVWWEPVPLPAGQAMLGHYSWRDLESGFIRPLNILDRLARET